VGTLGLVSDVSATAAGDQLLLIDGNSLAYRAFFALPESITTTAGFPTNALYGLAAMMVKVLGDETPGRVIVAWDPPGKVFRHDQYPEYKAGRRETPDLLREQTRWFRPLMEAFGFRNTEIAGFEADDVIGTLARRASEAGQTVTILTGDRDALQLVDERVSVLATGRGVTDTTLYTPERVEERYGVGPALMTDFRGLVGDSSDNLPGVPGIGEKGAATLLNRYGTLDEVLANAQEQTPKRRESLIEHAEDARMSRDLAVIDRNVPLELDPTDDADAPPFALDATRLAELNRVFDEFEFTSLKRRLEEITAERPEAAPDQLTISIAATQTPGSDLDSDLADGPVALAISDGVAAVADAAGAVLTVELDENGGAALVAALASRDVACHDVKGLPNDLREAILDRCHDTMIAAYLLEPRRRGQYQLEDLLEAAGIGFDEEADEPGAVRQAAGVRELSARQAPAIEAEGLGSLMRDVEIPVAAVLANMEQLGITLDVARLGEIAARVRDNADELRDQIWDLAGGEFVIESPKQLGQVLFERLELPTYRRGKTGWSTDRQVLKLLEDKHPIVPLIGRYRELTKLDSTYLSALPELIDPSDGRLHTTFNQTVAETGRLSSEHPNLQNIPIRTPLGREIRDAFVAAEGHVLVSCDYSQVELRILAHLSGEPALRDAFIRGDDIHRATAAEVFGMAPGDVDKTTRDRAKAVNFGIVYGISDFGLGEQLGIPRADAGRYIEAYLQRYPRVQSFIDTTIANATQEGLVTTVFGRRRPIPELSGRTVQQRQRGERLAVNTVIQGSAADIMKAAMVQAEADLNGSGLAARLVLQIHDELLIEAPKGEAGRAGEIVRRAMVGAFDLDPPLVVDVGSGETWLEAK
jgi:DNA polymerase-1